MEAEDLIVAYEIDNPTSKQLAFPEQDLFVNDDNQFLAAECTRRAGKTNALALKFINQMQKYPNSLSRYIALTRDSAKDIMWPVLSDLNDIFKLGADLTESNLTMTLPNGAKLKLFGADMKNFIRRLKGAKSPAVAIDECFHPDTLVETNSGPKRIAEIIPGEYVKNATNFGRVLKVKAKHIDGCRTLSYGERSVKCSDNHPFLTTRGWINASDLMIGDHLVTQELSMWLLRQDISEAEWPCLSVLQSKLLREVSVEVGEVYRLQKESQPYVQCQDEKEGIEFVKEDWTSPTNPPWEWSSADIGGGDDFVSYSRFIMELCRTTWVSGWRISKQLQSGLELAESEDWNRGRWPISSTAIETRARQKERIKAAVIRLDNIEVHESSSDDRNPNGYFYDLKVEGHPSFTVNGVLVHNCQDFGPHLSSLINDVLTPTIADYPDSWLAVTGTPGPVPRGTFYDIVQQGIGEFSVHRWSLFQNPYLPNAKEFVEKLKKRQKWEDNNPTLLREWYGKWVLDLESLLIRYEAKTAHFDEPPKQNYTYIMGIDLGFNDADALAVLGWSGSDPTTYLVEERIERKQGLTELVQQINSLRDKYRISKLVIDEGGLGKKLAEELRRRHHIPVQPAEKSRKMENVAFLNDALRTGKFKARRDSHFAQDSYSVQIDYEKTTPDKIVVKKGFHSDIIDAVLYGFKESPAFTYQKPVPIPKYQTPEWYAKQVTDMEKSAEEYFEKQHKLEEGT